jgi:hypothetical protein
MFHLWKH